MNRSLLLVFMLFMPGIVLAISSRGAARPDSLWVDSVYHSLSMEQRIAQLMIIRAYSDRDSAYTDSLVNQVRRYNPGGICFFKGSPGRQVNLTNRMQDSAATPLLICMDAEWGLGMRLDSAYSFPRQMTLGAIRDESQIYSVASCIAKDCRRIGVNINFAPVVDINNNPLNPVISSRSFGEDKAAVGKKGVLYMKGLEDNGIMATAKHFPGHGDTDTDSHLSLPAIRQTPEELDTVELVPFMDLVDRGVRGIMVGHLYLPVFDSSSPVPATLSKQIISEMLRGKLGYHGLIITDALDMQAVTKLLKPGEIELKALLAGNDLLLLPQDLGKAIQSIKAAADSNLALSSLIEEKCRKILLLKYKAGLSGFKEINTASLRNDLNPVDYEVLTRKIFREAITVVKNQYDLIPLNFLDRRKIAVLSVGGNGNDLFPETIGDYAKTDHYCLPVAFKPAAADSMLGLLNSYNLILIGLHCKSSNPSKNFGITEETLRLIDSCSSRAKVILAVFGSPYALRLIRNPGRIETILVSYEDNRITQQLSAELIFGGYPAGGTLPVTGSPGFPIGTGMVTPEKRLEYVLPEEIGIPSLSLSSIDSLITKGIEAGAYPGCQVLFAWKDKVFYRKSFGHPLYGDTIPVRNDDLYDLASLTKVISTTLAVMKLYEEGRINPDEPLGKYLPKVKGTNKEKLTIRSIMAHQAGLQPWIRFYEKTLKEGMPDPAIYDTIETPEFPLRVAEKMYIRKDYPDSVYRQILASSLREDKDYKYSDLGFYLLKLAVENITGQSLDDYVSSKFYKPLGLTTMTYQPRAHFPLSRIIPMENDTEFRKQLIHGDVHDPGAAMLGGVGGHAGLFSDANDLAIILQMLMNEGEYGGKRYFLPSTIREFTKVQFPGNGNRRGMGFDKPQISFTPDGPSCKSASPQSYGHSGFTGTYIWADPSNDLLYVFLSNRVYPSASNQKLSEMNIRTRVHQAMYDILYSIQNKNK